MEEEKLLWGGQIDSYHHKVKQDPSEFFNELAKEIVRETDIYHILVCAMIVEPSGFILSILCLEEDAKKLVDWMYKDGSPQSFNINGEIIKINNVFLFPTGIFAPGQQGSSSWEEIKKGFIKCEGFRYPDKTLYPVEAYKGWKETIWNCVKSIFNF